MTIEYLLEKSEKCSSSFQKATPSEVSAIIEGAHGQIATLAVPLKRLRAKRNRILAHIDPTIVSNPVKLAKECQVKFSELDLIFRAAGRILNDLFVAYHDTSPLLQLVGETDYETAVQLIVDAKHDQVDRCENEFKQPSPLPRPKRPRSPLY